MPHDRECLWGLRLMLFRDCRRGIMARPGGKPVSRRQRKLLAGVTRRQRATQQAAATVRPSVGVGAWRTARVFLSSTFLDMQSERDVLIKVVIPVLREVRSRVCPTPWPVPRPDAKNA